MSRKDPAFLFYSKDWLEGTAEMLPAEKGIYVDLLAYQHTNGDLPNDTLRLARLVRLSHEDFLNLWETVKNKFEPNGEPNGSRLVNKKLNDVMNERSESAKKNRISGNFASLLKSANLDKKQYSDIRKDFKVENFMQYSNDQIQEKLTEWYAKWLTEWSKSIEDVNVNEDESVIENIIVILNEILNTNYSSKTEKTKTLIKARLKEGFTVDDFRSVITFKNKQWGTDVKMREFLRPETLFSNKFESYLQASKINNNPPLKMVH